MGKRRGPESDEPRGITRRQLLQSAGTAAAAGAAFGAGEALGQDAGGGGEVVGPGDVPVALRVNGKDRTIRVPPRRTLLDALRGDVQLTGAKKVCDRGTCGACTVWLDGCPVYACTLLAIEAEGAEITTVEGLGTADALHPVQDAFRQYDALQCGFCTPGFVMSVAHAVEVHGKSLTRDRLLPMISGNLCRCGTYPHVVAAAFAAAGVRETSGGEVR